jgi:dolichol-phosphate mannosyltransferase
MTNLVEISLNGGRSRKDAPPNSVVDSSTHQPLLTVIIPCFNERETVVEIIRRVRELPIDKSVIVIDNCSTDGTRELLRSGCSNERPLKQSVWPTSGEAGPRVLDGDGFLLVLQPRNLKKGTSVKLGLALANSEYVICQDADLEYCPSDILRLLERAQSRGAAAVFGSRLMNRSQLQLSAFQLGRIGLTRFFCLLYGSSITDVATCYKLMRTDVARSLCLRGAGFDLDFEIAARLRRCNHDIEELPITYVPRSNTQGKKIRWRDGISAAWTLIKSRVL